MDRLELMQMLLGHPEADVQVDLGELLLDVRDVRYSADREAVVLLLHPADVRDVFRRERGGPASRSGEDTAGAEPRRR